MTHETKKNHDYNKYGLCTFKIIITTLKDLTLYSPNHKLTPHIALKTLAEKTQFCSEDSLVADRFATKLLGSFVAKTIVFLYKMLRKFEKLTKAPFFILNARGMKTNTK